MIRPDLRDLINRQKSIERLNNNNTINNDTDNNNNTRALLKKTRVTMNKPLYLGMSILDISKTLMHNIWYDYFKPNYGERAKLGYTDTDSFIIYIKTEGFFKIFLMILKNGLARLTMIKMIKDLFQ